MEIMKIDIEESLLIKHPELAQEWDYDKNGILKPYHVKEYSNIKVFWICHICGWRWEAIIYNRSRGRGCPNCAGKILIKGTNDLATMFPDIALQWDYDKNGEIKPDEVFPRSNKVVYWRCDKYGQSWKARISSRASGNGCPYCSNTKAAPGYTDLETKQPEIAAQWNYEKNRGLLPYMVTESSDREVDWCCSTCGNTWKAAIKTRTKGENCPYCAGLRLIKGKNDLQTKKPELVEQWDFVLNDGLKPTEIMSSSAKKVYWKCKICNQSWLQSPARRRKSGNCPFCSGKRIIVGVTDLKSKRPKLVEEWDTESNGDLKPTDVMEYSSRKVTWRCSYCKNRWNATIIQRSKGSGCPYCNGKLPIKGITDLGTKKPELSREWDYEENFDLKPTDVTEHSNKKVAWICSNCGQKWRATINNRSNGKGCPNCSGYKKRVRKNV